MIQYMSELMEDAKDFLWQDARAAHAVLLCEIERGGTNWEDPSRIDRIRRAHAQKHVNGGRSWVKNDMLQKPWYCKQFQSGSCSHNSNSAKVKVMSGEGSPSVFRQCCCVFYSKQHKPAEVESLLVRPCAQAIKVYNAIARTTEARSYAEVVKGEHKGRKNALASSKTWVFGANNNNISNQGKVWPLQANARHNDVLSRDNEKECDTETVFSQIAKVADTSIDSGSMKVSTSLNTADWVDIDMVCDTRPHEYFQK